MIHHHLTQLIATTQPITPHNPHTHTNPHNPLLLDYKNRKPPRYFEVIDEKDDDITYIVRRQYKHRDSDTQRKS